MRGCKGTPKIRNLKYTKYQQKIRNPGNIPKSTNQENKPIESGDPKKVLRTNQNDKGVRKTYANIIQHQPNIEEKRNELVLQEVLRRLDTLNEGMKEQRETIKVISEKLEEQRQTNKTIFERLNKIDPRVKPKRQYRQ